MNLKFTQMLIQKHEGYRMTVYRDSRGFQTIGYGFNLSDPSAGETCTVHGLSLADLMAGSPISVSQATDVMTDQILAAVLSARSLIPAFSSLPDDAQAVVIDMIFNLGAAGFAEFKETIAALNEIPPNYELASERMAQSDWYRQTGARAVEDCSLMFSA